MSNEIDSNSSNELKKSAPIIFDTQWPKAYPELDMTASFKSLEEDFRVSEVTNRELTEAGPHLYLYIEKKGTNTHWLARQLANHAKIDLKDVGYAGLKDRHAVTRQWFSLPIKNKEPDLTHLFNKDEFTLIEKGFYGVKLKRGNLGGNQFRLVVREIKGNKADIEARLELIKHNGVPNYFGQQRLVTITKICTKLPSFIKRGNVLVIARKPPCISRLPAPTYLTTCYLHALNLIRGINPLKEKYSVSQAAYAVLLKSITDEEKNRFNEKDIHPTCALWGKGESVAEGELNAIEQSVIKANDLFAQGVANQGMKQERRVSRLLLPDLAWEWESEDVLVLNFELGSGLFATSVLRELGNIVEVDHYPEPSESYQGGKKGEINEISREP